jgi:hypothetical protein
MVHLFFLNLLDETPTAGLRREQGVKSQAAARDSRTEGLKANLSFSDSTLHLSRRIYSTQTDNQRDADSPQLQQETANQKADNHDFASSILPSSDSLDSGEEVPMRPLPRFPGCPICKA